MPVCLEHEIIENPIDRELRRRCGTGGIGVKAKFSGPVNEREVRAWLMENAGFGFHPGGYDWTVKVTGQGVLAYVSGGSD